MSIESIDESTRSALAPLGRPDSRDTLMGRYREVAHAVPHATALTAGGRSLTFDDLLHSVYSQARKIAALFPTDSGPIAVNADATVDSTVLMLAVVAAGHPLVPLDPRLPAERRSEIVGQSRAREVDAASVAAAVDSCTPLRTLTGDQVAVINYTSGSTGKAKGVVLSHRMCLTKAYEVASALGLGPRDRVGNALPVSFGAGLNTLFAGLLSGAAVHCRDPRSGGPISTVEWIAGQSLTTLHCSSSLLRAIATAGSSASSTPALPTLRVVTTYGEALHSEDAAGFRRNFDSQATVVNWYATTEAGAISYSEYPVGRALPPGFLPAGKPSFRKRIEVVRGDGSLAATGETGEVRVTADCLATAYLGDPALSARRFVALGGGLVRYGTGDLGRFDADGVLNLAGRMDDAVKVRGYLVEPADVETCLRAIPGLSDVAVIARGPGADTELVAYVCPASAGRSPSVGEIRASLRRTLPEWMVPAHVVVIGELPRNERGKLDRSSLPAPAPRLVEHTKMGPTEFSVALAARTAMGLESIGLDEDFLALGGTSLTALAILSRLNEVFRIELAAEDMFSTGTVRTLAARVDQTLRTVEPERRRNGMHDVLVPLRTGGTGAPIFLIGGAGVGAMAFLEIVQHIDAIHPVYALQAHGRGKRGFVDRTVRRMAKRYVDAIRTVQPSGPFHLVGHSLGGWIVMAMAERIRDAGLGSPHLLILDTRLFRHVLDKVPGGTEVPAATPLQTREEVGFHLGRAGTAALWVRMQFAGLLRYPTTMEWLVFASIGYVALNKHVPTPWSGPMTVVRTADNVKDLRSWQIVAHGGLSFVDVSGDHVDMLVDPMVGELGKIIGDTFGHEQ